MASLFEIEAVESLENDLDTRTGPLVAQVYCPFLWPHWATGYDTMTHMKTRTAVVTDRRIHEDLYPWPIRHQARWGMHRVQQLREREIMADTKIFHVHNGWTMTSRGLELMKMYPDAKFVGQLIGTDINVHAQGPRTSKKYKQFFDRADRIVCISEFLAEKAVERGCPEEKIVVIPLSVDGDRLPGFKGAQDFSPPGHLKACLVARFVAVKNITDAIEACRLANSDEESFARVELHVCGGGPLRAPLVAQAAAANMALGWRAVTIHCSEKGLFDHDAAMKIMLDCDCVVSTSRRMPDGSEEGLGVSVIEGQMMGLPALCYWTGGLGEIVQQNITGWLGRTTEQLHMTRGPARPAPAEPTDFPSSTTEQGPEATAQGMAQAMVRLAHRRDVRQRMGANASEHARRFETGNVAHRLDALYQEILAG